MSDLAKKLECAIQEIRSVLLGTPVGLTLDKFCKDYKNLVGRQLPYAQFGYATAVEFLRNHPEVVRITYSPYTGTCMLSAVADETTKHIEKLVSKQKVNKKTQPVRTRRTITYTRRTPQYDYAFEAPPRFRATTAPSKPAVPSTIKNDICQLLLDYPDGVSISRFPYAYTKKTKRDFNFIVLGYKSLTACLADIPDVALSEHYGDTKISLRGQKPQKPSNKTPLLPSPNEKKVVTELYTWSSDDRKESPPCEIRCADYASDDETSSKMDDLDDFNSPVDDSSISERMKEDFLKVLRLNPNGIWAAEFPNTYEKIIGQKFDLSELGFFNLIELVDSLPDVFKRVKPEECKSDWLLFHANAKNICVPRTKEEEHAKRVSVGAAVIEKTILNIRKILQGNSEGVYIDEFIHLYSINCEFPLSLRELGFDNVEKFLLSIAEKVPLKVDYSNVRRKIRLGYAIAPTFQNELYISPSLNYREIPHDAVLPGVVYEWQTLPKVKKEEYFPLYMGTIVNPSLIWVQLYGKETSEALQTLMDQINVFYNSLEGDEYLMQDKHIVVHAVCASIWPVDKRWHRVEINGMPCGRDPIDVMEYIDVVYVDYGTRERVLKSELRYLRKEYMRLPAQGIKARMARIKPSSGDIWNPRVRDFLMEECGEDVLLAQILDSEYYPGYANLWLCCPSNDKDRFINLELCDKGYAVHITQVQDDIMFSPSSTVSSKLNIASNYLPESQALPKEQPKPNAQNYVSDEELYKAIKTICQYQLCAASLLNPATFQNIKKWLLQALGLDKIEETIPQPHRTMEINPSVISQHMARQYDSGIALVSPFNAKESYAENANPVQLPALHPPKSTPVHIAKPTEYQLPSQQQQDSVGPVYIKPPVSSVDAQETYESDSSESSRIAETFSEIFEDDEDDFATFCEDFGYTTLRHVVRINLRDNYRIHIIVVCDKPYASSGDISRLLWPKEDPQTLYRRLRNKDIVLPSLTIYEQDYTQHFYQCRCYHVKGIKEEDERSSVLFPLKNVIDILNIFGHPSPTIRDEISEQVKKFNSSDDVWKQFSAISLDDNDDDLYSETDNDKFHRMCLYDLKATLEGLSYKRLKIIKNLPAKDVSDPIQEVQKIEAQAKEYKERIKQIERICCFYKQ